LLLLTRHIWQSSHRAFFHCLKNARTKCVCFDCASYNDLNALAKDSRSAPLALQTEPRANCAANPFAESNGDDSFATVAVDLDALRFIQLYCFKTLQLFHRNANRRAF